MTEDQFKAVAMQLRKPEGEMGIQTGKRMNEGNGLINRFSIEALTLSEGDTVLEIGMGNGFFVPDIFVTKTGVNYIGCDFSADMIREATLLNEQLVSEGRVTFFLTDAAQLPLENESVNKILAVNTIYFWDNREGVFSEFRRVLADKGKIVIAVRPRSVMEQYPFTQYGFAMFEKEDLVNLIEENGFSVVEIVEKNEPDQEIAGKRFKVASLIVAAIKK